VAEAVGARGGRAARVGGEEVRRRVIRKNAGEGGTEADAGEGGGVRGEVDLCGVPPPPEGFVGEDGSLGLCGEEEG